MTKTVHLNDMMINLYWQPNEFDEPEQDLYAGYIYIGCIMHLEDSDDNPVRKYTPWYARLMTDSDGAEVGWYATKEEAQYELINRAIAQLDCGGHPA